jgi:hypothetical protein
MEFILVSLLSWVLLLPLFLFPALLFLVLLPVGFYELLIKDDEALTKNGSRLLRR